MATVKSQKSKIKSGTGLVFLAGLALLLFTFSDLCSQPGGTEGGIYHKGWIDFNKNNRRDLYEDPNAPIEERVEDLLSQMNMDEKTCQLTTLYGYGRILMDELPTPEWKNKLWKDGIANIDEHINGYSNKFGKFNINAYPWSDHARAMNQVQQWFIEETRLGIPVDFTNEGMYGIKHERSTMVCGPVGQASSWDREMVYRIGTMMAVEARALGYTNIYAPMLGVARNPLWARVAQTYGEDPYLVAQMGKQIITGLQDHHVASSPKHYVLYSIPLGGRDGNSRVDPQIPLRDMYQLVLEPWRVGIQEAGAMGAMASYIDYDGVPIIASDYFLTTILRERWGFKGYVVSDSDALEYLHTKHRVAANYKEGITQAFTAGLNVRTTFTPPEDFTIPLREAVAEGMLSEDIVDLRVAEVLRVKFRLGLFDEPFVEDPDAADEIVKSEAHKALALESARKAMVLLKNGSHMLPLDRRNLERIAVIGPLADSKKSLNPTQYSGINQDPVTVKEGLESYFEGGETEIVYGRGCEASDRNFPESDLYRFPMTVDEKEEMDRAVALAEDADVAVVVLGDDLRTQGESRSRVSLDFPGYQQELLEAVYGTGTPVVLVLINGRPITLNWANDHIDAILEAWIAGEYSGQAIAETIFGDNNPSGKLPVTFPKSTGQIPQTFPAKPGADGDGYARVDGNIYPFGHGLSYTHFEYSDLKIKKMNSDGREHFRISCRIKNAGWTDGAEIVQLYIRDEVSSVTTFEKNLRGFERIQLKRGASKTVEFEIAPEALGLYNRGYDFVAEPGDFTVCVGSSSEDIRLEGSFVLERGYTFGKAYNYKQIHQEQ
ncbi:MAG: glycoside hydrolase family 3 C-terminal domain-containing protein [Bacteroidota bacterium]